MKSTSYTIEPLTPVPQHVLGTREEFNMLAYGPSEILLANDGAEIAGAVRLALRQDERRKHGLIADLSVHADYARQGIADDLIVAAEERLKAAGVTKIDAIVRDGEGATVPFYERGYWASRKMVLLTWDLEALEALDTNHEFTYRRTRITRSGISRELRPRQLSTLLALVEGIQGRHPLAPR